ncbi:glycosyltransferase [Algoriphagus zhangzhouensis]|uniref:Glycosyltransferase involved in cell wall bisynthesis n=1 Tax=Algoriphagus zhangzhouensis TaxID=1073327 RepID=A0A1M7Z383_9BACT|nr:glycosyltransferase [Algoriphagus zhangzhouensis]TDY48370.1 glycosyltransferase involved in cell wall biosynthesis [Algoriphagus zhangzhouensis]SHO59417.1 Glycosyltransferase involved in cell wall bisynthesis [Algoriphagus zhangzhouensis]
MIKIFHFTSNLSGGGAETQLLLLAKSLTNVYQNFVVYNTVNDSFPFNDFPNIKFISNSEFLMLKNSLNFNNLIFHIWIPDVFTHLSPLFFFKFRKITILGVRNKYRLNSIKRIYQFLCYFFFSNIVSNTPSSIHNYFYRLAFGKYFLFIPNAIKYNSLLHNDLNFKKFELLFVGRFEMHKGVLDLLNSFTKLNDASVNLKLVGTGSLFKSIKNKFNKCSNLEIVGYLDDPIDYFYHSECLILPSYYEGMPNVAFEALSQNCILILSDIPQNRLWFTVDSVIYFKPGDYLDLLRALKLFLSLSLEQKRYMLSKSKSVIKKLTIENYSNQYIRLYKNIYEKSI